VIVQTHRKIAVAGATARVGRHLVAVLEAEGHEVVPISRQIGGAVGIALLSTIAVSTTTDELGRGTAMPDALTDGLVNAFWVGTAIAFVGVLVSVFRVRERDLRARELPSVAPLVESS
jgi:nucleoside-diphosphate-sugar epimerase